MSESTKGQSNRGKIRKSIENSLEKYVNEYYSTAINKIAYEFNLAPDTLRYSYFPMFLDMNIIYIDKEGKLQLGKKVYPPEMKPYLDAKKKLAEEKTG